MPKIQINQQEIEVAAGTTIIQACEQAGVEIPRFCYHKGLSVAGNCRMCLVELEKAPKLIASCATAVADGMKVHTNTEKVKQGREGVMEFLLINHPLDCPVCDQGGECDLQDQALNYGRGYSRFEEAKRAVIDPDFGPLIKTHMTRCIHCTRCIRFATEVAGVEELGALGRGEDMRVTTCLDQMLTSELSGNMIDLCPVGALTAKPYAFQARKWELKQTETIDIMDAVGSNVLVCTRQQEVLRILPVENPEINEAWLSDKSRFCYDGLNIQRLDRPYFKKNGKLIAISWAEANTILLEKFTQSAVDKIACLAGQLCDAETIFMLKQFSAYLGCDNFDGKLVGHQAPSLEPYLFASKIAGIEEADLCLLVGCNPRHAATLLNARLKKRSRASADFKIYALGEVPEQTYPVELINLDLAELNQILADAQHWFSQLFSQAQKPIIIIGEAIVSLAEATNIFANLAQMVQQYQPDNAWPILNFLPSQAADVAVSAFGLYPQAQGLTSAESLAAAQSGTLDLLWLVGADEAIATQTIDAKTFVIYQGHHADNGVMQADLILPSTAYTEKNVSYINLEGRWQQTKAAVKPLGQARDDALIIAELWQLLAQHRQKDTSLIPETLPQITQASLAAYQAILQKPAQAQKIKAQKLKSCKLKVPIGAYYTSNAIARCSATLAKCAKLLQGQES